jgi:hypothetical protein
VTRLGISLDELFETGDPEPTRVPVSRWKAPSEGVVSTPPIGCGCAPDLEPQLDADGLDLGGRRPRRRPARGRLT